MAMKTTFVARHMETERDLQAYSLDAISKLEHFFDRIISCDIIIEPDSDPDQPCRAELNIKVPKKLINTSEKGQTYEQAINSAVDTASRQIRKYKSRLFEHN